MNLPHHLSKIFRYAPKANLLAVRTERKTNDFIRVFSIVEQGHQEIVQNELENIEKILE